MPTARPAANPLSTAEPLTRRQTPARSAAANRDRRWRASVVALGRARRLLPIVLAVIVVEILVSLLVSLLLRAARRADRLHRAAGPAHHRTIVASNKRRELTIWLQPRGTHQAWACCILLLAVALDVAHWQAQRSDGLCRTWSGCHRGARGCASGTQTCSPSAAAGCAQSRQAARQWQGADGNGRMGTICSFLEMALGQSSTCSQILRSGQGQQDNHLCHKLVRGKQHPVQSTISVTNPHMLESPGHGQPQGNSHLRLRDMERASRERDRPRGDRSRGDRDRERCESSVMRT